MHAHGEIEQRPFPQKEPGFKVGLFVLHLKINKSYFIKKIIFLMKLNLFLVKICLVQKKFVMSKRSLVYGKKNQFNKKKLSALMLI